MDYESLLIEADSHNLIVKEKPLQAHNGRIKGNRIAIRNNIPTKEKACVLAEELGHYHTTYGDIMDQSKTENRKQEARARLWAYNRMITLEKIIEAKRKGCRNCYEIAEFLEVTEEFLIDALKRYTSIYGLVMEKNGYIITFEPFNIYKVTD